MTVAISTGIIFFALVIAFSNSVRTGIWLIYKYLITLTVIKSGLYDRVYLKLDWKSRDMVRKLEDCVTQMKMEVKAARQKRMKARSKHFNAMEGNCSRSDTRETGSGSGAEAQQNNITHGVDGSPSASSSRLRPRPSRPVAESTEDKDQTHVIQMDVLVRANPTSVTSTVSPALTRNSNANVSSASRPLEL